MLRAIQPTIIKHSMKNLYLDDWKFNQKLSPDKRMAHMTVLLKYPSWQVLAKMKIEKRRKYLNDFLKSNFKKLLDTKYFDKYELVGTKMKPSGIKTKAPLASLLRLAQLSFIGSIHINQLQGATRKPDKAFKFFCVKMTVSVQVEGFTSGMQLCEDRYVIVKASNSLSAIKKIQKQEKDYGEPYVNSDLRLVSWKIESYDDCYETYIFNINDLSNPEGVEVFSKLRSRKLTPERAWKN